MPNNEFRVVYEVYEYSVHSVYHVVQFRVVQIIDYTSTVLYSVPTVQCSSTRGRKRELEICVHEQILMVYSRVAMYSTVEFGMNIFVLYIFVNIYTTFFISLPKIFEKYKILIFGKIQIITKFSRKYSRSNATGKTRQSIALLFKWLLSFQTIFYCFMTHFMEIAGVWTSQAYLYTLVLVSFSIQYGKNTDTFFFSLLTL